MNKDEVKSGSMDALLAKLSEQQGLLARQKAALSTGSDEENVKPDEGSSNNSSLLMPASEAHSNPQYVRDREAIARGEAAEVAKLKRELEDAKDRLARQTQELNQSRVIRQTLEQTMTSASDGPLSPTINIGHLTGPFTTIPRQGWINNDDARSDVSDLNAPSSIWTGPPRPMLNQGMQSDSAWGFGTGRPFNQRGTGNIGPMVIPQQQPLQRNYSVPVSPSSGVNTRGVGDFQPSNNGRGYGQFSHQNNRNASTFGPRANNYEMFPGPSASSTDGINLGGMNPGSAYQSMGMYQGYQPQPIGTPLSPTAHEFRSGQGPSNPWNTAVSIRHYQSRFFSNIGYSLPHLQARLMCHRWSH